MTAKTRYRVVAYELHAHAETVVMDSTGDGFIAATGTIVHTHRMDPEIGSGGPKLIQEHLADLIAEETT